MLLRVLLTRWSGALGYGNEDHIGDDELPSSVGEVDIGGVAVAVMAGPRVTCALLDTDELRCWGVDWAGRGLPNTPPIGDDELPSSAPTVDIGGLVGYLPTSVATDTCVILVDNSLRHRAPARVIG